MNIVRRTWAEISLDSIRHNFLQIKNKIGDTKLCCVIKADAYGHGAVQLAHIYEKLGADFFAVSNIDEAKELRDNEITAPILVLGYTPVTAVKELSSYCISQAVYSLEYAKELSEECVKNNVVINAHIKIDTGMSRIGFMCQEFPRDNYSKEEIKEACSLPHIIPEGVFTHFAVADDGDNGEAYTKKQYENFIHTVDELEKQGIRFAIRHCSNSGAIMDYPSMRLDMVRAGIVLYG